MHPAPSIIVFTTLSGLGFGLLAFLGLGLPSATGLPAAIYFAGAFGLTGCGIIASTFHLGHPERSIKAFTQWRSSWLSREACLAVGALATMGIFAGISVFTGTRLYALGTPGAALSLLAVYATSMIYAQLRTVPRWNQHSTPILFLAYALAGGALLAGQPVIAIPLLCLLGAVQLWSWRNGDGRLAGSGTTLESATGLGIGGKVRSFEPPHTGTNYLLSEMVHVVGRRHARKLRLIGFVLLVALPFLFLIALPVHLAVIALASLCHFAGALICRWLFFAEAEHVVGFYYGKRPTS